MANQLSEISTRRLIVSDTQKPFHAPKSLEFVRYIKRHFKIPDSGMMHAGDESDQYHGSGFKKSPNALHTPSGELSALRYELNRWYSEFPLMKLCISNHGIRYFKKACEAEIPSEVLRSYREVIGAPDGWVWKHEWRVTDGRMPWRLIHGMGYSGMNGHRTAAIDAGISTAIGHLHSHAGVAHIRTGGEDDDTISQILWAMNVGSLIDLQAYAFEYGKYSRFKPCLGIGVVVNHGTTPIWLPYDL
jgi:hypothetical protein